MKASEANASPADAKAGLGGAEFKLYKTYDDAEKGENAIGTYSSDADGYKIIEGLDAGTYYLVETKAPDGYVKSGNPVAVIVDSENADKYNVVFVEFANAPIPHTGGTGTFLYLIGGACLIAAAGALFILSRRKQS